jgi:hypothetical protein
MINEIRVVLDNYENYVQKLIYWGSYDGVDDLVRIGSQDAHEYMRRGVPVTITLADPSDPHSHYEGETILVRI